MSTPDDEARSRARRTYDAAADVYDHPSNTFWERFGRRTIERLDLRDGMHVLDVCCGTGASALPAAAVVGPTGRVLGIDLAERPLEKARAKAAARGLSNVQFRVGDLQEPRSIGERYDAVVCVFGLFFVPDMVEALRALWRRVRPGGKLAITTWGPDFFEPASGAFWRAIQSERPDLHRGFNPWDRLCDPFALDAVLTEAGITKSRTIAEANRHPLATPDDWWAAVLGSGYRGTVDQLNGPARHRVEAVNRAFIRDSGIDSVEANVVYAIADKADA